MTPGRIVHNMPDADYRAAPGVSVSRLKHMGRSPAHYRHEVDHPMTPTRSMVLGTLFHDAVLLGRRPWGTLPADHDGRTKAGKRIVAEIKSLGLEPVKSDEHDNLLGMIAALDRHPVVDTLMRVGSPEVSLFDVDDVTGLPRKGRLDWLTHDADGQPWIMDLKKTQDAGPGAFARQAADLGYHVQQAYYQDLYHSITVDWPRFVFVAVEEEAPHGVGVYELDPAACEAGDLKWRTWLARVKECEASGEWPDYPPEITSLALPRWGL